MDGKFVAENPASSLVFDYKPFVDAVRKLLLTLRGDWVAQNRLRRRILAQLWGNSQRKVRAARILTGATYDIRTADVLETLAWKTLEEASLIDYYVQNCK